MANIKVIFDNTDYLVDESALTPALDALKSHLSTTMNGTGATIKLGGTAYSVDSAKLTSARTTFVTHLGTIAGTGSKVNVGGVEYNLDSSKLNMAVSAISSALNGLANGGSGDEEPALISFSISGTEYQAEDGMTWGEWVESEYNTGNVGVTTSGDVYLGSATRLISTDGKYANRVKPTTVIIADQAYAIYSNSGEED